jgi:hypothetical protein
MVETGSDFLSGDLISASLALFGLWFQFFNLTEAPNYRKTESWPPRRKKAQGAQANRR